MKEGAMKSNLDLPPSSVNDDTLAAIDSRVRHAQGVADLLLAGSGYSPQIDEVAAIFGDMSDLMGYVGAAVQNPLVEHFNGAFDEVDTAPIVSHYAVRYDFLRILGAPYRVECMALVGGISPLHAPFQAVASDGPRFVHASFKVSDIQEYDDVVSVLDRHMRPAQMCESTYGHFSYWPIRDEDGHVFYLKPRVNTRDGVI